MFSFPCAHCGHLEIPHVEGFKDNFERNLWPDIEYQEDFDRDDLEDTDGGSKRKSGYRYSLKTCPGFQYRKSDRISVIECFAENKKFLEYAPDEWIDAARALAVKYGLDDG